MAFPAQAEDIPQETIVRFNTVCARCHEGECSGRLTFDLDSSAAANHMQRHAGELALAEQKNLHTLLVYMKQRCAYYPMQALPTREGGWDQATLSALRTPKGDAHFIPLGVLAPGHYRARLRFAAAAEACAQVISAGFDISEHPGLKTNGLEMGFDFQAEQATHYLRLQTAGPAVLQKLEIQRLK